MKRIACIALPLSCVPLAAAQTTYEQGGARIEFQAFNPSTNSWSNSVEGGEVFSGLRVEWRMVLTYTGTRTDLFALGEMAYQPVLLNADVVDSGNGVDTLGPWRNGGVSGNTIAGSMLTEADGYTGSPLPSYGRVRFGATLTGSATGNTITTFAHPGGSNGGPDGFHYRIAGSTATQWPRSLAGPVPPLDVLQSDMDNISHGMSAKQLSQAASPAFHVPGLSVVLLRQSLTISNNTVDPRVIFLTVQRESLLRVGGATGASEGDDRRYISWQTNAGDNGSHRTVDPQIVPLVMPVFWTPSPGSLGLCGVAAVWGCKRRRF